jgi:hypothetical protein
MLSCSYPIFALSNHTTFSQTQTGATVALKEELACRKSSPENAEKPVCGFKKFLRFMALNGFLFAEH